MSKTLASYGRFLLASLTNQGQTGAVVPSQRFLIARMLSPVSPAFSGTVVELGPGTGALTFRLAARCPKARILACEINPMLAEHLEQRVIEAGLQDRIEVIVGPAQIVLARLGEEEETRVPYIISGIPLGNLVGERALTLIEAIAGALQPGGMYIQFQHSLLDRSKIRDRFTKLRTVPVLLNFPPAVVYYAQKGAGTPPRGKGAGAAKQLALPLLLGLGLLCGCAQQYVMRLSNGTKIVTASKPRLQGSNYHFKDALGRDNVVPQSRVQEIAPQSMAEEENKWKPQSPKKKKWYWPF